VPIFLLKATMEKVSDELARLMQTDAPERPVRVVAMLRADLSRADFGQTMDSIRKMIAGTPIEVFELNKSVAARMTLRDVSRLAQFENVFWIDLDHKASIESLLDSRHD
jgi:hypothetical protein